MLTLKLLREDPQFVIKRLAVKNFDASAIVEKILEQDRGRAGRMRPRRPRRKWLR